MKQECQRAPTKWSPAIEEAWRALSVEIDDFVSTASSPLDTA
jgi:hypothetical protein